MAQQTLNSNSVQPQGLPNTGTGVEQGDSWDAVLSKLNAMLTELYSGAGIFGGEIGAGATKTLVAANNKQTIKLDTAAGSVVTLPAATGSGFKARFLVSVLATSASHKVQVANASDFMVGVIAGARVDSGNAVLGFAAANSGTVATNSDTITLNRSTTGSVSVGEWIEVEDVAANTWAVSGFLTATGAAFATPFSAAV